MSEPFEFTDEPIETGLEPLVTATVTEPPAVGETEMTPEAVQAAKALVNLPSISAVELAQLAREIAQDIDQIGAILQRHHLTQAHYDFLERHNKFFRQVLESEIRNWQSVKSTETRLRLQAQAALEQVMPVVAQRVGSAAEKLTDVVEGAKFLSRVAGVDAPAVGPAPVGERYKIVIDLGAGSDVVIAAQSGAQAGAGPAAAHHVSDNAQGQGQSSALRRDGQGQGNLPALPAVPEG
jgi:hypothetical protein